MKIMRLVNHSSKLSVPTMTMDLKKNFNKSLTNKAFPPEASTLPDFPSKNLHLQAAGPVPTKSTLIRRAQPTKNIPLIHPITP
ncbi:hypothetical protein H5410_027628 [Solanum commersonii]|uniref:Uncharacterized protein n=1 Tax=Solanum commersonii TaxID=4109 RepID=A0A9J5Z2F8_SOLCO|nr:hypothetical protein H5410_027628 [Solanum commersonii]